MSSLLPEQWLDRLAVEQTILVQSGAIFPTSVFLFTRFLITKILALSKTSNGTSSSSEKVISEGISKAISNLGGLIPFLFYYGRLLYTRKLYGPLSPQFLGDGMEGKGWRDFTRYKRMSRYFDMEIIKEGRENLMLSSSNKDGIESDKTRKHSNNIQNKNQEINPYSDSNYLFAVHPHGIFVMMALLGLSSNGCGFDDDEDLKHLNMKFAVSDAPFWVPGMREYALHTGAISLNSKAIRHNFAQNNSVGIVVGGVDEAMLSGSNDNKLRLVLKKRRGFIKMALLGGVKIVPVLNFGENGLVKQWFSPVIRKWQKVQHKAIGFAMPLIKPQIDSWEFWKNPIGLAPNKRKLTMVLGEPFDVVGYLGPMFPTKKVEMGVGDTHTGTTGGGLKASPPGTAGVKGASSSSSSSLSSTSSSLPAMKESEKRYRTVLDLDKMTKKDLENALTVAHEGYLECLKRLHRKYAWKYGGDGGKEDQILEFISAEESRSDSLMEEMTRGMMKDGVGGSGGGSGGGVNAGNRAKL